MKRGKSIKSVDGEEMSLPEAMIQHIQSFLSGKEAARTTLISKSWYNAWLTRPSLDLDSHDFDSSSRGSRFEEYATKTMRRYQESSLNIDSFRLRCYRWDTKKLSSITRNLVVNAMKIGATNVKLELGNDYHTLPQEVLESETLVRLSLSYCRVDGKYIVRCSNLKSLALDDVVFTSYDVFKDMITCCSFSIEELSLSGHGIILEFMAMNSSELHKLRRLDLSSSFRSSVTVDGMFFTGFASRFPCLKDLTIDFYCGFRGIQIASTSLETITFKISCEAWQCKARFDVPNIRKFTCYSGSGLPSFTIKASREWVLDISIRCYVFRKGSPSWFLNLKKFLAKFRLSRISLSIKLNKYIARGRSEHEHEQEVDIKFVPKPLVLENLMIDGPSSLCCALLVRLFGICRPKFITHYWLTAECYDASFKNAVFDVLFKKLMHQGIAPDCGIPDQNKFAMFNLKKVNVEVYEMFDAEWQPLVLKEPLDASETPVNKRKIRFQLIWED